MCWLYRLCMFRDDRGNIIVSVKLIVRSLLPLRMWHVWGCMCTMENTTSHSWDLLKLGRQGWSRDLERDGSWRLCWTPDGVETFSKQLWIFESDLFSEMPRMELDKYFTIFPSKFSRHLYSLNALLWRMYSKVSFFPPQYMLKIKNNR